MFVFVFPCVNCDYKTNPIAKLRNQRNKEKSTNILFENIQNKMEGLTVIIRVTNLRVIVVSAQCYCLVLTWTSDGLKMLELQIIQRKRHSHELVIKIKQCTWVLSIVLAVLQLMTAYLRLINFNLKKKRLYMQKRKLQVIRLSLIWMDILCFCSNQTTNFVSLVVNGESIFSSLELNFSERIKYILLYS